MIYLDTSVALAWLLTEDRQPPASFWDGTLVSSRLLEYEIRINYKDIAMLAHRFAVSYQAALYRLKSLRHVSHGQSRELLEREEFGRQLLRELGMAGDVEESEPRDRELRSEIAHLAIEAYRREEISRSRVLELSKMLGMNADVLLRLAEAARGE